MGEVYRAADTRLGREVAIKVLPPNLAADPERRRRLEREARAISALQHPHICGLYDIGHAEGVDYLVMEYLEGETLAQRLGRSALPMEQCLRTGAEIAEALHAAHRRGIVHRDLKPGNIMLTSSGAKLLDFGLAKVGAESPPPGPSLPASGITPTATSPTLDQPLTQAGALLGTQQYMAPEQVEGKEVDARTDIFTLGAVLFEMATGQRAFGRPTPLATAGAILEQDPPPVRELRPKAGGPFERLVATCLAKSPDQRWQCAQDVALQLRALTATAGEATAEPPRRRVLATAAAMGALATALLAALAWQAWRGPGEIAGPVTRFALAAPEGVEIAADVEEHNLAVSPDGRQLAFVAGPPERRQLWVRALAEPEPRLLAGTEGAGSPFRSPDGGEIAFFARGRLLRIPVGGGPAQVVCAVQGTNSTGTWGDRGTILFTEFQGRPGIHSVPAAGGEPVPLEIALPALEEVWPRWVRWLPDERGYLFMAFSEQGVAVFGVKRGKQRPELLLPLATRVELAGDQLLYVRERVLMARSFDTRAMRFTGEARPVASSLPFFLTGWAPFAASRDTLVFQAGDSLSTLAWLSRDGDEPRLLGEPGLFNSLALAPDGERIAVEIANPERTESDLWVLDPRRGTRSRVTSMRGMASSPVWSPDGAWLAFGTHGFVDNSLRIQEIGGNEEAELAVAPSDNFQFPSDWSPDGRFLAFDQFDAATGWDIWIAPLDGSGEPYALKRTSAHEGRARFSPDQQWIAYLSEESGRQEIYLQPFLGPGESRRASAAGGSDPRWAADGSEIFYLAPGGDLVSIRVTPGPDGPSVEQPTLVMAAGGGGVFRIRGTEMSQYAPSTDGRRVLAMLASGTDRPPLTVVLNWRGGE